MVPALTAFDCIRFQRYVTLPTFIGGAVTPNPSFWPHLVRRKSAAAALDFLRSVRKKYDQRVWSFLPFAATLLVFDRDGIEEILGSTAPPTNSADPWIKKFQVSVFTSQGATISRPPSWCARRRLNEEALGFRYTTHPDAGDFMEVVQEEVKRMLSLKPPVLAWDDFCALGARVSQRVILGRSEYRDDTAGHLARLVSASNFGFIRRHADFIPFYEDIDSALQRNQNRHAASPSLVRRVACPEGRPYPADAEASSQIAFWLFVMKDAIELHTARTLALISGAPSSVRTRLTEELRCAGGDTTRMPFLEACIKEGLRLWTPVPILLRVALEDFTLGKTDQQPAVTVRRKQQLFIPAGAYHRDPDVFGDCADTFRPDKRMSAEAQNTAPITDSCASAEAPNAASMTDPSPPLYVFSRHRQSCAGQFLVIFLLKAVLSTILTETRITTLDEPVPIDPVPAAIDHFALRFGTT